MMTKETSKTQYNLSVSEFGLAGATTGVITRFCCQPLDVLKIRFQVNFEFYSFLHSCNNFVTIIIILISYKLRQSVGNPKNQSIDP